MHTRNKTDVADAPASPTAITRTHHKINELHAEGQTTKSIVSKAGPKTTGLTEDESIDGSDIAIDVNESDKNPKTGSVILALIMDMC